MRSYDHSSVEKKWQKIWEEKEAFKASCDPKKPKYYVLDMFPYPSGSGLHVGHVVNYTATDIIARYKRMQGYNVLHPMGWDSFGLPAEQYAIRTGTHPAVTTKNNVDAFRIQLKNLGFSYDWDREFATSDPSYYKWTQWIFTKLYEKGLAYEANISVNFCPALGTVLANEEVDAGRAKDGGHPVIKKPLRQWVLKITEYADRLIEDLDLVDWPESIKALQTNWIGKSLGAEIHFSLENHTDEIVVFTTRHDTIFGCTYLVLAPEHPLIDSITQDSQKEQVKKYQDRAFHETEIERTEAKIKTGVFTGSYALHPITGKKVPIWVADYVLPNYGTGAVMGVPAQCERDFEFAKSYNIPIIQVVMPPKEASDEEKKLQKAWEGPGIMVNSSYKDLELDGKHNEAAKELICDWLISNKKGQKKVCYKLRDWLFSRQRYWGEPFPILHFEDGTKRALAIDELPLLPPHLEDFKPSPSGESPLSRVKEWVNIIDPKTGKKAQRETNTMPQWAGSCWYYLRFCDPHNSGEAWDKQIEKYWMPVDLYVGGVEHAVLHLLYARFWHKVLYDIGLVSTLEPFYKLRNQGLIVCRSFKTANNVYIAPSDVEERDGKYFDKKTGVELQSQIEKMSKSKLTGASPDDLVTEWGADSLRLYEMFLGPLEREKVWVTDPISGCRRFLSRIFDMVQSNKVTDKDTDEAKRLINRLIHSVSLDMEALQFNTAIAKFMEFLNDFSKLESYPKSALLDLVKLVNPFAPHITEELWEMLGQKDLFAATYPVADPNYLQEKMVIYAIQINGKVRGTIDTAPDLDQETVAKLAREQHNVAKFLEGMTIKKTIFVPNKLVSFVVG